MINSHPTLFILLFWFFLVLIIQYALLFIGLMNDDFGNKKEVKAWLIPWPIALLIFFVTSFTKKYKDLPEL